MERGRRGRHRALGDGARAVERPSYDPRFVDVTVRARAEILIEVHLEPLPVRIEEEIFLFLLRRRRRLCLHDKLLRCFLLDGVVGI